MAHVGHVPDGIIPLMVKTDKFYRYFDISEIKWIPDPVYWKNYCSAPIIGIVQSSSNPYYLRSLAKNHGAARNAG